MSEAVAVPKSAVTAKSGSGKTVFAGVMVFVLLVAFATTFYFLGGVDLVTGLVDTWFAAAPTGSQTPPSGNNGKSPAAVTTATPSATESETAGLKLPDGVDEPFARRVYAEQLESQENLGRLVDGEVSSFALGKVRIRRGRATIPLTVRFTDKGRLSGEMVLAQKGGKWYLESIARDANLVLENSPEHIAEALNIEVDEGVLSTMLEQQEANQELIGGIVDGTYTKISCGEVTKGPGTASIDITLEGPKKASVKGRVLCISKDIDGTQWFLTSFSKS